MWYRRFVSWLRSLFAGVSQEIDQPTSQSAEPFNLPMTSPLCEPLSEPLSPLDQSAPPPPTDELPPRHQPPTTVPLGRLVFPSQPLTEYVTWGGREPPQPTQPTQPSQPSRPGDAAWPAPESAAMEQSDHDDQALSNEPGSDLYRRLMILRRLVRQHVYNEGFTPDETPEQYQRYPGLDDLDRPFDAS